MSKHRSRIKRFAPFCCCWTSDHGSEGNLLTIGNLKVRGFCWGGVKQQDKAKEKGDKLNKDAMIPLKKVDFYENTVEMSSMDAKVITEMTGLSEAYMVDVESTMPRHWWRSCWDCWHWRWQKPSRHGVFIDSVQSLPENLHELRCWMRQRAFHGASAWDFLHPRLHERQQHLGLEWWWVQHTLLVLWLTIRKSTGREPDTDPRHCFATWVLTPQSDNPELLNLDYN